MNLLVLKILEEQSTSIVLISAAFTCLLFWAIKIEAPNCAFLLLGLLPSVFIFLLTPNNRIVSAHGFWHTSIVYQIMNGNIPPNNPLLAGETLYYPWATHLLVAGISDGLHLSPPNAFVLVNLCALLLTMSLVFTISRFFSTERIVNVFAVFFSIFGLTFINAFSNQSPHPRAVPVFIKFGQINNTHLGVLCFALFLYSVLSIFSKPTNVKPHYATLVISVVCVGFFYPLHWLGVLACCFSCCLILYLWHGRKVLPKIVSVLACVTGGTLVVLPYLYLIGSGKSEAASPLTLASPSHILRYGFMYLLTVLPVLIILFWKRKILLDILYVKINPILILISAIATTALMYILLSGPLGIEYKYAILSYFSLGIVSSVCIRDIYINHKIICFFLIASFLLPFSTYLIEKVQYFTFDYTYIIEDGRYLRHHNPEEDDLYRWIGSQTNKNAIFVDSNLPTIALFGRRQVYYGQPDEEGWSFRIRGWYQPFKFLGYSRKKTEVRKKVVDEIFSNSKNKINDEVFSTLEKISDTGDIYVVARTTISNKKLANDEHFDRVFERGETAVYKLSAF